MWTMRHWQVVTHAKRAAAAVQNWHRFSYQRRLARLSLHQTVRVGLTHGVCLDRCWIDQSSFGGSRV